MGLDKGEFIRSVQEALGVGQRKTAPPYARLQESLPEIETRARAIQGRLGEKLEELSEKLADVSQMRGWKVARASTPEDVLDYICNLAASSGVRVAVRSDEEIFRRVPIDGPLSTMSIEVTVMARDSGASREGLRQQAARADIGITGADYAVAETGSVVVLPRRGLSRLVSLTPPIHVAILRSQEILESLDDVFTLRRLAYYQGGEDMGSYMNLITGPSRTADIEQTLVIGVHGPQEAHLVLLQ